MTQQAMKSEPLPTTREELDSTLLANEDDGTLGRFTAGDIEMHVYHMQECSSYTVTLRIDRDGDPLIVFLTTHEIKDLVRAATAADLLFDLDRHRIDPDAAASKLAELGVIPSRKHLPDSK